MYRAKKVFVELIIKNTENKTHADEKKNSRYFDDSAFIWAFIFLCSFSFSSFWSSLLLFVMMLLDLVRVMPALIDVPNILVWQKDAVRRTHLLP